MSHQGLSISELIKEIKKDIEEFDGKLNIYKGKYCGGESKCSGLFYLDNNESPILKIAKGSNPEQWVGILIHEYCHFLQWRDNSKAWRTFAEGCASFDDLMLNPAKYKKEIIDLISLELDCEKKTARIIKANNYFDINIYIKNANAILLKYVYLYYNNKWPSNFSKFKKVQDKCPAKLLKSSSDYLNIDKNILSIFN
jgi:hypothetical protein